jgi:hypothetical protein
MKLNGAKDENLNTYDRLKWRLYLISLDIQYHVWDRLIVRYLITPCPPLRRVYDRMMRIRRQRLYNHP